MKKDTKYPKVAGKRSKQANSRIPQRSFLPINIQNFSYAPLDQIAPQQDNTYAYPSVTLPVEQMKITTQKNNKYSHSIEEESFQINIDIPDSTKFKKQITKGKIILIMFCKDTKESDHKNPNGKLIVKNLISNFQLPSPEKIKQDNSNLMKKVDEKLEKEEEKLNHPQAKESTNFNFDQLEEMSDLMLDDIGKFET